MPRATPAIVAFNGGELSPVIRGRVDLTRYASGCRTLVNFMVMAEGPVTRRPGTKFVAEVSVPTIGGGGGPE
jgi:hypothetical protein